MSNIKYENWIKKGLEKGLTDVEIYAVNNTNLSIEVYEGKVEKNEVSRLNTALIKGIYNNKAAKVKVENLSDENINYMLDKLIDAAKHITANEPALIYEGSKEYPIVEEENFDFATIDPTKKVQLLLDVEKGILKNEYVTKVDSVSYSETESETVIINSKGLNLNKHHTYATCFASAVFEKDGQIKSSYGYKIARKYSDFDANQIINECIERGVSQLGAKSIASKNYPVVFSNEMFGNILRVYASIFTGEAAFRNLTKLVGKQNTKIASPIVNLIDDPLHEKALFKVPFDDEGVACKKRYWIKDGVFTDFAHNLKTAEIFKTTSTGNGFTNGITPTNLYLEPQDITFDQLIAPIKQGVYITNLVGLHAGAETVSGNFSLQAAGFEILDGKINRPVDMIVVSGNFFTLLNDIENVANDFIFGLSGVGTGSVKVKGLTIGGK